MAECARQAKLHNVRNTTKTETKVKPTPLNPIRLLSVLTEEANAKLR